MKITKQNPYGQSETVERSENEERMSQDTDLAYLARICVTVVAVVFLIGLTICTGIYIAHH